MRMENKGGSGLKVYGWIGLAVIGISEILLFAGVPFVRTFFTPLVWSGYILLADGLVFRQKGNSLIMSRPREFLLLLPLSIGFWLIFEFYNLYLRNWHYVGLPEELPLRLLGLCLGFCHDLAGHPGDCRTAGRVGRNFPAKNSPLEDPEGTSGFFRWFSGPSA